MTLVTIVKRAVPIIVFVAAAFAAHQSVRAVDGDKTSATAAAWSFNPDN